VRLIRKGAEPPLLLAYRQTSGATYEAVPAAVKTELREALVREQGGLCCYCMGRIGDDPMRAKIEHWTPQSVGPADALAWRNLLGACKGNEGSRRAEQHCDTRKGDEVVRIDPREAHHIATLSYTAAGELRSSVADFQDDIDTRLGLNLAMLVNNRREVVRRMAEAIGRKHRGKSFSASVLRDELERARSVGPEGSLESYAGAIEWWLAKRLAQLERAPR
jgi:uncharacterized protein (TIGR02646 family)